MPKLNGKSIRIIPPKKLTLSKVQPTPIVPYPDRFPIVNMLWAMKRKITTMVNRFVFKRLMNRA